MFFLNINHKINILNSFVKVWIVLYVQILINRLAPFFVEDSLFIPDANQENKHLFSDIIKYTQLGSLAQAKLGLLSEMNSISPLMGSLTPVSAHT